MEQRSTCLRKSWPSPLAPAGAGDQAGHVGHDELDVAGLHHAEVRDQGGERVVGAGAVRALALPPSGPGAPGGGGSRAGWPSSRPPRGSRHRRGRRYPRPGRRAASTFPVNRGAAVPAMAAGGDCSVTRLANSATFLSTHDKGGPGGCPARLVVLPVASLGERVCARLGRDDAHGPATAAPAELDLALDQREQRVVITPADAVARVEGQRPRPWWGR